MGWRVEAGLDQLGLQRAGRSTDTLPVPCCPARASLLFPSAEGSDTRVENKNEFSANKLWGAQAPEWVLLCHPSKKDGWVRERGPPSICLLPTRFGSGQMAYWVPSSRSAPLIPPTSPCRLTSLQLNSSPVLSCPLALD